MDVEHILLNFNSDRSNVPKGLRKTVTKGVKPPDLVHLFPPVDDLTQQIKSEHTVANLRKVFMYFKWYGTR